MSKDKTQTNADPKSSVGPQNPTEKPLPPPPRPPLYTDDVIRAARSVGCNPSEVLAWRDYPDGCAVITQRGQRLTGAAR